MKKMNTAKILALNPTLLKEVTNQLGQVVKFYEHPTQGDLAPVLALIEGEVVCTDFFDTDDFYENSEYLPVMQHGEIECAFNFGF